MPKQLGELKLCHDAPPLNDSITSTVRPDGIWSDGFTSASGECVSLYDNFEAAYNEGRVVVAEMPLNQWGAYSGSGDQQGTIGIANATFNLGNNEFVASTAIHESAHDLGCDDTSPGQTAQAWADYCVPPDPQVPPPPPLPCAGM